MNTRTTFVFFLIIVSSISWALAAQGSSAANTSSETAGSSETTAPLAVAHGGQAQSGLTCSDCHADAYEALDATPHVALKRQALVTGMLGTEGATNACTSCHTDAEAHLQSDGEEAVFNFADSPASSTATCQQCHGRSHPRFERTSHARAGLTCTDCHGSHSKPATFDAGTDGCGSCHVDQAQTFAFTEHHRLDEGTLSCSSCHDPHEPSARIQLGGFKQQECSTCHQAQAGPFVFEHGAQRVEGCTACHSPHGSPNRHLLTNQSVADQCYSCHGAVPGFHTRFTSETLCTNCHVTIHGSHLDPAFLK